jgi:hypothetical protein
VRAVRWAGCWPAFILLAQGDFVTEGTEDSRSFTEQARVRGCMAFAAELCVLWETKFHYERVIDAVRRAGVQEPGGGAERR